MGANPVEVTNMYSSIVFTIGLFYYMYMHYKRLFLNWIKQKDPRNTFENNLRGNNQTLKNHVKNVSRFDHLIIFNSFSWLDTRVGFSYWADLYTDWIQFYTEWVQKHQNNTSYEL